MAFLTNIVPVNAAVYRRGAGEMGPGFALLGGEVVTVASGCADAAKEIRSLISD
ncbi:methyl-accepting chemotaxis protein, partial [Enterobacter asburiae]